MSLIRKNEDNDLKLYLDIVNELKFCYRTDKLLFEYSFVKMDYESFYTFKRAKKQQIKALFKRLRKALNIIDITKFVDI